MTKSRASALSISRRKFMAGTGVAGAALASNLAAPGILAQTRAPIRLGNLNSFTGAIAYAAEANLNAMNLYFDSIGWTIAGRKVEIIKEDDQFNPQVGLQKVKKLVESDKVDLVVGVQASNVALAVLNYMKQQKAFYVVSGAGTDANYLGPQPVSVSHFDLDLSAQHADGEVCVREPRQGDRHDRLRYAGGRDVIAQFKGPYLAMAARCSRRYGRRSAPRTSAPI